MEWTWEQIEPYFKELQAHTLDEQNIHPWLATWSRLNDLLSERYTRLTVATTLDTNDQDADTRYNAFLDNIFPGWQAAEQKLKDLLLASGLEPQGFEVPLRKMRAEAALFREENLPLLSRERKLATQYNRILGAQTVTWEGEERTLQQMRPVYQMPRREVRQQAWRLSAERQLADRDAIDDLWRQFMALRKQLAQNADLPDYRRYRWQQLLRLDYTPEDCLEFQTAIEQVAVPAASRVYENQRRRLGVERLRPWDLDLDLYIIHLPALPSYGSVADLESTAEVIFQKVDPKLGGYFHILRAEGLLDLANYKGKAPGGYCTGFPVTRRPFIFMNAVGLPGDVRTILHESGHAFHNFERMRLPYAQQRNPGLEFSEVASMSMELLASPYLAKSQGGFYGEREAALALLEQLERVLFFWPYMAVVDAFQHWVYTHHDQASEPANCDARWLELWTRFMPGVDWSGLEAEAMTGWQRKQHIFRYPLYYVEYGVAQLGAVQVWRNALQDQAFSVRRYLQALSLGGTATLPQLYQSAGAKFAFDAETLGAAVQLVEETITSLERRIYQ
jgi:oligoendopeptidase F